MIRECELRNIALQTAQMKRKSSFQNKQPKKKQKTDHEKLMTLQKQVRVLKSADEIRTFDVSITGATLSTSGISSTYPSLIRNLNCPTLGDFYNNRLGNEVKSIGFKVKGAIYTQTAELVQQHLRVIIWVDKMNIGILNPSVIGNANSNALLDLSTQQLVEHMPTVWQNRKRYKILYNKVLISNPQVTLDYDPVSGNSSLFAGRSMDFETYVPFTRIINYNQANGGIASDIMQNAVYMAVISNAPQNTVIQYCNAAFTSRWFFHED